MTSTPLRVGTGPTNTSAAARVTGRLLVLECIRNSEQIARIDISEQTGLSAATVTTITAELLDAGLIAPVLALQATKGAKRGRPREALCIQPQARLVAGLKVARGSITVLLSDFRGEPLTTTDYEMPKDRFQGAQLCDEILAATAQACAHQGLTLEDVSVLSIALAGQVDGTTGYVHWSSSLERRNVPLGQMLSDRIDCPVFIENDANLVAKAEQLFGEGRGYDTFIVVTLDHGIGLGIVIDGTLYRGARGCGAEFGHTKVSNDGALCQCGQHGCLEAYAGTYAMLDGANAGGNGPYPDLASLSEAADAGDAAASHILDRAGRVFALGLANLINIFDPQLLIIASHTETPHPLCRPAVLDHVASMVVQVDAPAPQMLTHTWGDMMWAKGAAASGLEKISEISAGQLGGRL